MSPIRSRLTYANVVSTTCLFVLLGGSAYAATQITGKNVKDGSLTGADIANNSLTSADVKNLTRRDFKRGALPTTGRRGPIGPQGLTGAQGPTGPQGPGAKRIWVDTNVGLGDGDVFSTSDFTISVQCGANSAVVVKRQAPANVAVSTMLVQQGNTTPSEDSVFLDGSPGHVFTVMSAGGGGSAVGNAIIQSYAPGTDTARNYTLQIAISNEGANGCAAFGSVTPAA